LKNKYSRKLVSADHTSNIGDFKHNYMVDIAPICKDDLLILPKDLAAKQSNISPLVIVKRVGSCIFVIDPITAEVKPSSPTPFYVTLLFPFLFVCLVVYHRKLRSMLKSTFDMVFNQF
jgi:nonsense-mediated mRNA decay protein 3